MIPSNMTTLEYIRSLGDKNFRFDEMDRLYMTEPTIAFLNSIPSKYKDSIFAKHFVERAILTDRHPLHFSNNFSELDGTYDFIYDQTTGYIFFSLQSDHARMMARIAALRLCIDEPKYDFKSIENSRNAFSLAVKIQTLEDRTPISTPKLSELYLTEGYGVFMSSVSSRMGRKKITLSHNFKMTEQEKSIFKDFTFDYID